MIYQIYQIDAETLLKKPETGMGYQIINASSHNNKNLIKKFVVYNTDLAVELDSNFQINKQIIINEGYKSVLNSATVLMLDTNSIKVFEHSSIKEIRALSSSKRIYNKRISGGSGATESPKVFANGTDIYVRISAYEDDKRIDFQKMRLKEGSFTTTSDDYINCVSTEDNPIDRYALPNDEKIKWAFFIKPLYTNILQRGIVQPAFNHEGGGIETYFENGTSEGTFLLKKEYGK